MEKKFIDAHTHVHFSAFENDWREAIKRAHNNGVALITVGTQRDTSRRAVEVSSQYHFGVYATVGLHPIHTAKSFHDPYELGGGDSAKAFTSRGEDFDFDYYKKLALDPKVVAIGECGLDYYRMEGEKDELKKKQKEAFIAQMRVAHDVGKPLMIHCREAFEDLIGIIRSEKNLLAPQSGVIHFFTGKAEDAKRLLELGFSFTFGGVTTFTKDYDEVIREIPLDRLMSETDAPYVAPIPYRGKRN